MSTDTANEATLLDLLRINTRVFDPSTIVEAEKCMRLIRKHQEEFPSIIRAAIKARANIEHAPLFVGEIHHEVGKLFIGFLANTNGLYCDVDTEAEAELAIRFLLQNPRVIAAFLLQDEEVTRMKTDFPLFGISLILFFKKTVAFVPLFLKVAVETYGANPHDEFFLDIASQLLVNRPGQQAFDEDFQEDPSAELDERSLEALIKLRESGWIDNESICSLMARLLDGQIELDSAFIEERLRLLIGWNPSILKGFKGHSSLFSYFHIRCRYRMKKDIALKTFRIICELGMSHFPEELGYIFHGSTYRDFCNFYWTHPIAEIFEEKLFRTLRENSNVTLQQLVFSAATNDKIPLDGLFTLFRCDPNALLSKALTCSRKRDMDMESSIRTKKTKLPNEKVDAP